MMMIINSYMYSVYYRGRIPLHSQKQDIPSWLIPFICDLSRYTPHLYKNPESFGNVVSRIRAPPVIASKVYPKFQSYNDSFVCVTKRNYYSETLRYNNFDVCCLGIILPITLDG